MISNLAEYSGTEQDPELHYVMPKRQTQPVPTEYTGDYVFYEF